MTKHNPGISIFREVENYDDIDHNGLYQRALEKGINKRHVKILGRKVLVANIVSSHEIQEFLVERGERTVAAEIDELSDFLESWWPDSGDISITIPTFPFGNYLPLGSTVIRLFTLGTINEVIRDERTQFISLIKAFFEAGDVESQHMLPNLEYAPEVWIARVQGLDDIGIFRDILRSEELSPEFLPDTIELGPAIIEDT